ncbi:family 43 glycosylhydrolase [Hymenobacter cheonanensis]|uniref:family 43 glycosylhydrolase n=1 Tax=Hymenobacter sp. CA2-7 TaxID=3063993 RepID=UPI002712F996|nr:family 43 glycosylhydrolase [Hymenobacter sp. CA2-7]MDO7886862.1 family 43 glycosylhydrolase [Hymenobacter sp. CA2-7]
MVASLLVRARQLALLVAVLVAWAVAPAYALQGALGIHDPSTIVKSGNTYWVFGTGDGIACKYSTDLINWTDAKSVYTKTLYPGWINGKVPGFAGTFWAPECKYLNGKYYLYYSCSTFGSQVSTIGLATNPTLDPASPDFKWTDQGEVVSSTALGNSAPNAIDPALFTDASNNLWLTYGSYFGGIRVTQLDAATGKPLNVNTQYAVANGGVEASYVAYNNGYYYLFVNRGTCCNGAASTYYIQVGRSASPTGPFLDQAGADLNNNGGTTLLSKSGRYVGPGHAGLLTEGGITYFSHHYYDGYDNGAPKLGLAQLTWGTTGWPTVSRDWLAAGRYTIKSQNSGLVWDAWGCTGVSGQMVAQGTPSGLTCQQWDLVPLGTGYYKITNALGGLALDVINCLPDAGTKLQLYASNGLVCQQYGIERASNGDYIFTSATGNNVVEVPNCSTTPGQQLGLWYYNGFNCQRWTATLANAPLAAASAQRLAGVSIYPVPATAGNFTVELGSLGASSSTTVEVFNLLGQPVYRREFGPQQTRLAVAAGLSAGSYLVRVRREGGIFTQKVPVF